MKSKGLDLPKNVTKFLVLSDNPKYLRFVFGKAGMFVESITSIAGKTAHGQFARPTIVFAKYDSEEQIRLLQKENPRLQPKRIFKSVWKRPKSRDKIDAFIYSCAKNLLNLAKGKTLRIVCKDRELQQRFYNVFLKVNEEDKLGCKFDYDEYDVVLSIKEYISEQTVLESVKVSVTQTGKLVAQWLKTAEDIKHWFITSVTGLNSPSSNS